MKVYVLFQNVEYEGDYMEDVFFTYEDADKFLNTRIPKKYRRDYHISGVGSEGHSACVIS